MKISVAQLSPKGIELVFSGADIWAKQMVKGALGETYQAADPFTGSIAVKKSQGLVQVTGTGEFTAHFFCDRCLAKITQPIALDFHQLLSPQIKTANLSKEEEIELSEDDVNFSFYEGDEIDLAEIFYEQLVLELPDANLCKSDCKGLCGQCGRNSNLETCSCSTKPSPTSPFAALKDISFS